MGKLWLPRCEIWRGFGKSNMWALTIVFQGLRNVSKWGGGDFSYCLRIATRKSSMEFRTCPIIDPDKVSSKSRRAVDANSPVYDIKSLMVLTFLSVWTRRMTDQPYRKMSCCTHYFVKYAEIFFRTADHHIRKTPKPIIKLDRNRASYEGRQD